MLMFVFVKYVNLENILNFCLNGGQCGSGWRVGRLHQPTTLGKRVHDVATPLPIPATRQLNNQNGPTLHPRASDKVHALPISTVCAADLNSSAKVLLKTNFGDLELELWGTQCPLTTKNFLQHIYDGYYTSTLFHRLVPGFILQGGDPTNTGHGGDSIYPSGVFADEFHPRLKFNRRGLLGMANSGRKDDNGSQFFLTLGETPELTGHNTLFGKIVGDTVYNLVRMGELECEEGSERPLYPPTVTGAEVLVNPFPDVGPKEVKVPEKPAATKKKPAAGKKKGGKALLSFAGDEEDEAPQPVRKKPKFDTRLVVDTPEMERARAEAQAAAKSEPALPKDEPVAPVESAKPVAAKPSPQIISSRSPSPEPDRAAAKLAQTNAEIAALKRSLRRSASPPPAAVAAAAGKQKKVSLLQVQKTLLKPTSIQGRKRRNRRDNDDEDSFLALQRFQEKLASAPAVAPKDTEPSAPKAMGAADEGADDDAEAALCDLHFIPNCQSCSSWDKVEGNDDDDDEGTAEELWGHALSFDKDRLGKDLTWKKKNEELVVIDPREKEKTILAKKKGGGGEKSSRRREDEKRAGGRR